MVKSTAGCDWRLWGGSFSCLASVSLPVNAKRGHLHVVGAAGYAEAAHVPPSLKAREHLIEARDPTSNSLIP